MVLDGNQAFFKTETSSFRLGEKKYKTALLKIYKCSKTYPIGPN
jgi:hypothetical protein